MAPSTALVLLILCATLGAYPYFAKSKVFRFLSEAAAIGAGLVALLVIVANLAGADFDWEQWLVPAGVTAIGITTGRMSPMTAWVVLLVAFGLLALLPSLASRPVLRRLATSATLFGGIFCATIALTYLAGTPFFYNIHAIPMALSTAVALTLLCFVNFAQLLEGTWSTGFQGDVRRKLALGFTTVVFLLLSVAIVAFMGLLGVHHSQETIIEKDFANVLELSQFHAYLNAERLDVAVMLSKPTDEWPKWESDMEESSRQNDEALSRLAERCDGDLVALRKIEEIISLRKIFKEVRKTQVLTALHASQLDEAKAVVFGPQLERFVRMREMARALVEEEKAKTQAVVAQSDHQIKVFTLVVVGIGGLAILGAVAVGLFTQRSISKNIEQRHHAEKELRTSEERLRLALQGSGGGTWDFDLINRRAWWSLEMCEMFGISPETDLESSRLLNLTHPQDRPRVENAMERAISKREPYRIEYRILHPVHGERWMASSAHLLCDPLGRPVRMLGVSFDITDRKRAEESLRRSELRYRSFVELTNQWAWVCDANGGVVEDIPALQTFTGQTAAQIRGNGWFVSVHPEDVARTTEAWQRAVETHTSYEAKYRMRRHDGVYRLMLARGVPILDEQGNVSEWVGTCFDITDRERAEKDKREMETRLQQTQRLESLGVLAGGIAHDFNNILAGILGCAELTLVELSPVSPGRDNILEIKNASLRAAELCQQMLAYSGKGRFESRGILIGDLIDETLHMLKTCISKKCILNLNLEKQIPAMRGDPSQIRQVVMNLVINASEAIGERSGVITISTGAMDCQDDYLADGYIFEALSPGMFIYLEVSDTGCGMDKETVQRIFEPFFTTKFTGRGLGLSAVLGIVRGHKGALRVYSEPGKGTTFKVLFPAIAASEEAVPATNSSDDWRGRGTILLVDDEETIRAISGKLLRRLGFEVLFANDGRQAVDLYRQRQSDVAIVLMDLTMPHMNGEDAFREMRRINPEVRVILASGYSDKDLSSRLAGKGLAGCLQKPYTLANLVAMLSSVLPKHN